MEWINFPRQQSRNAGTAYLTDIVEHLPPSMGNQYYDNDRVTWGHETTHGINSHIRNTFAKNRGVGFYVGNDKAAIMSQPRLTLSQIGNMIPQNLRGNRYQLYFISQARQWNDSPLYCFDEWVAYTNGGAVGLEIPMRTEAEQVTLANTDVMIGALEFSIYALYACVAIDKYDPQYLQNNVQFKEFLAHELQRSLGIYRKGIVMPQYRWETALDRNVIQNQECITILKKMYGDALTMEMLFGNATQNPTNDLPQGNQPLFDSGPSWRWSNGLTLGFDVRDYRRGNGLLGSH